MTAPRKQPAPYHVRIVHEEDGYQYSVPATMKEPDLCGTLAGFGVYTREAGLLRRVGNGTPLHPTRAAAVEACKAMNGSGVSADLLPLLGDVLRGPA